MATLQERVEALKKGNLQGRVEALRGQPASRPESFIQQGIARAAGAPVDLINGLLGLVGLGSEEPIGGRASLESGFRSVGVPTPRPGEEPQTLAGHIARGVGDVAGGLATLGPMTQAAASAGRPVAQNIAGTFARQPVASTAAEVASGVGSGTGGFVAKKLFGEDDTLAVAMGEMLGGLSPIGAKYTPTGIAIRGTSALAKGGARKAKEALVPFTDTGARPRAADRLQSVTGDRERALTELGGPNPGGLSPAQRTGQTGPLSLEAAVRAKNAQLDERFRIQLDESEARLKQGIQDIGGGEPGVARSFLEKRRDQRLALFDARLRQAGAAVRQRLEGMIPSQRRDQASTVVREEIEQSLSDARVAESNVWGRIPDGVTSPMSEARSTWDNVLSGRDVVDDPEDIPGFLYEFLGKQGKPGSLGERPSAKSVHRLRSRVLAEARKERAQDAPNRNKLRILSDIGEALMTDLISIDDGGSAYEEAIEFSRVLNDTYTRGAVGKVLGYERRGGVQVAPESTLEGIIPKAGSPAAGRDVEQVLQAVKESGTSQQAIKDFMLDRFQRAAVTAEGDVNVGAAQRFLANNQEVLDKFPSVRREVELLVRDARSTERLGQSVARARGKLTNQNVSATARFLNAPLGDEMRRVIKAPNPRRAAAELVRQVRKDDTGQALKGLKTALVDFLLEGDLNKALGNPRVNAVVSEILDSGAKQRLQTLRRELDKVGLARSTRAAKEGVISDTPNAILTMIGRVTGAQSGQAVARMTGGGTVQTPGIFSGAARRHIEKLTNDRASVLLERALVEDPALFTALMADPKTEKALTLAQKNLNTRLNAFLAGPGSEMLEDEGPLDIGRPRPVGEQIERVIETFGQ